jgi:hypothetical protein
MIRCTYCHGLIFDFSFVIYKGKPYCCFECASKDNKK